MQRHYINSHVQVPTGFLNSSSSFNLISDTSTLNVSARIEMIQNKFELELKLPF